MYTIFLCLECRRDLSAQFTFHHDIDDSFFVHTAHDFNRNIHKFIIDHYWNSILLFFCKNTVYGKLRGKHFHLTHIKTRHMIAVYHRLHHIFCKFA